MVRASSTPYHMWGRASTNSRLLATQIVRSRLRFYGSAVEASVALGALLTMLFETFQRHHDIRFPCTWTRTRE